MERKQITIISDGTPRGTSALNADGKEIPGITSIKTSISVDTLCTAVIKFTDVMLKMSATMVEVNEIILATDQALWQRHPLKQWANKKTGKHPVYQCVIEDESDEEE